METQVESRYIETVIAGTFYIVESMSSKGARETAESKVKRLILNNFNSNNSTDKTTNTLTSSRT